MAEKGPRLPAVLLAGWPGSGKSTVGRALARRLRAALVDQDTVTGPLVAVVADLVGVHDLDDERLAGPHATARYDTVAASPRRTCASAPPSSSWLPFTRSGATCRPGSADGRLRAAGGAPLLVWLQLEPAAVVRPVARPGCARRPRPSSRTPPPSSRGSDRRTPADRISWWTPRRPPADIVVEILAALAWPSASLVVRTARPLAIDGIGEVMRGIDLAVPSMAQNARTAGTSMSGDRSILRDVATTAGVSLRTASRVLNEDPRVAAGNPRTGPADDAGPAATRPT